jgi:hypothetical protein
MKSYDEQLGKLVHFINRSKKINSSTRLVNPGFGRQQTFISEMETRTQIFKLVRSPRIDSNEPIPPGW